MVQAGHVLDDSFLVCFQMESLSDKDARQRLYNSALEERRVALRAELKKKQVASKEEVKPLCGSQMDDDKVKLLPAPCPSHRIYLHRQHGQ